jgi:hypothetical protein
MIRYALACEVGHDFESWFPSSASFDAQAERGLVSCPICGSGKVAKQLMAPSLGRKGSVASEPNEAPAAPETLPVPSAPPQPVAIMSEKEQAIRAMLRAVREHVTRNSDYVGTGFADEARKMHYGEIEHRSIYGEANAADAKALIEEGIEFHPLPLAPDDRN